jgi:charged multivesicular body protein 5
MNRIFGKKKEAPPPPSMTEAAGRVDGRVGTLDAQIEQLDNELRKYKAQMKNAKGSAATSIKKRAMATLKRKKMYEQQRDSMAAQSFNIEQTTMAMDTAKDQIEVVAAMKGAAAALKTEVKKIDLDSVEDTMDDMADLMEEMGEITEMLGQSYGGLEDVDEADLEAELDGLGFDDELDVGLGDAEPAVPSYLQTAPEATLASEEPAAVPATGVDEYGLPTAPVSA